PVLDVRSSTTITSPDRLSRRPARSDSRVERPPGAPRSDAMFGLDPANSPAAACASSASRQVSSGHPQESPKSSKHRQEIGRQGLDYSAKAAEARVARAFTGDTTGKFRGSRTVGYRSPFAESTLRSEPAQESRNERTDRDVDLPWNNRERTN